jgi:hypothetical protein
MLEGQCFCGFVRYATDGRPYNLTNCHCSICRRLSGAAFVTWFSVPLASFRFLTNEPAAIKTSEHGRRTFCPRCGTPLTFRSERSPQEIDVTTCSLDDPSALPPEDHTQVSSMVPWIRLGDGLPAFPERRSP